MIRTGHGRPLRVLTLGALALLALAPSAHAASPYGNVVAATLPRPAADEVVLARVQVRMGLREGAQGPLGSLAVRRASRLPRGYGIAAVRARPRGDSVTIRLVAVRTSGAARSGRSLRVRLRIGGRHLAYRRATTRTVRIGPETSVRRLPECGTIGGEAARWTPVAGLRGIRLGGRTFAARTAVGAVQQIACERRIASVPALAARAFLQAVDRDFGDGASVEGFFATWAKDAAGNAKICIYVRGARGATGDVTVARTTQRFALDDARGVARVDTQVAGEGAYAFTVRWRQPDGTYRRSEGVLRVPAGGGRGDGPPQPYAAAGSCA